MKKILLHTCCAPCLIYPAQQLQKQGYSVTGLFYNPNIHPYAEYKARRQAVEGYSATADITVVYPDYVPQEFFRAVNMRKDRPQRCLICWRERLRVTARMARDGGYAHFSTTLLVSPYQDQDALRNIGSEVAAEEGMGFYYEDFRPGFRAAHDEARAAGIYCQKYCGCVYSEVERYKKSSV